MPAIHMKPDTQFRLVTIVAFITLGIGTVFYHIVEKLQWLDSLYFSVISLATVGYGDIAPKTDLGKLFTIVYVLTGLGIIGAFAHSIVERAAERRLRRLEKKTKKTPHKKAT